LMRPMLRKKERMSHVPPTVVTSHMMRAKVSFTAI